MVTVDVMVLLSVFLPLALVPAIYVSRRHKNVPEALSLTVAAATILSVFTLVPRVLGGEVLVWNLWEVLPGLELGFRVDGLGMLFAIVASVLWFVTTIYSIGYMRGAHEHAQVRYFGYFALAVFCTLGVAFAGNLLTLYVFYELLSLSTYPLVTHHQDEEARAAGRKYLKYIVGASVGLVLPAMMVVHHLAGDLSFGDGPILGSLIRDDIPGWGLGLVLLMMVFGFAKSGLMPFHRWLPGAMVAPTPVSSLLHAVAVVKVGVFCVIRVITDVFGVELAGLLSFGPIRPIAVVQGVAAFTIVVSSLIAWRQNELKKRLAYSTIGQLAYIIQGAALLAPLSVTGSALHIAMHAFGKITLFFCAGAIYVAVHKKKIKDLVGIGRRMPITMACFFVGTLSVIGLPPTGGIMSKLLLVQGTLEAGSIVFLVIYLISSFLNCAYYLPIVYRAFFCRDEDSLWEGPRQEPPRWCLVPPVVTAVCCVILFVFPDVFLGLAELFTMGVVR